MQGPRGRDDIDVEADDEGEKDANRQADERKPFLDPIDHRRVTLTLRYKVNAVNKMAGPGRGVSARCTISFR